MRDLALLPGVGFVSASNDGTARAWELGGSCLKVIKASETFVYGVGVLESGEWMTWAEAARRYRLYCSADGYTLTVASTTAARATVHGLAPNSTLAFKVVAELRAPASLSAASASEASSAPSAPLTLRDAGVNQTLPD